MKSILLKISTILLLFTIMGAGCENESSPDNPYQKEEEEKENNKEKEEVDEIPLVEISPNSKDTVIQKSIDGIDFKFCLLNENGEPATIFNEGENFSFYFSVINNRENDSLCFDPDFVYNKDVDFCKVFDSENQDLGRPYELLCIEDILICFPFNTADSYVFEVPWLDRSDATLQWDGQFLRIHQEPLTQGEYYTGLKYRFGFWRKLFEPSFSIDTNFRINFVIQ